MLANLLIIGIKSMSVEVLFIVPFVWNAKLTETQIFRELSIEIESSLFQ